MIFLIGLSAQLLSADCSITPSAPTLSLPAADQVHVSVSPIFVWNAPSVDAGCTVHYDLYQDSSITSDCLTKQRVLSGFDDTATQYAWPSLFEFSAGAEVYWCVRAYTDSAHKSSFARGHFTVRGSSPATPQFDGSLPSSGSSEVILLKATGGEEGSTGKFYLDRGADGEVVVGSTTIGSSATGAYSIVVDLRLYGSGSATYVFKTQVVRSVSKVSAKSSTYSYQYNADGRLPAPEVTNAEAASDLTLKWRAVSGATSYKVWRRYAKESCDPLSEECYLGFKPFKKISPALSSSVSGGVTTWSAALSSDLASAPAGAHGVSYFVTAENLAGSSIRSLSKSFSDTTAPFRTLNPHQVNTSLQPISFVGLSSGHEMVGFLCNLDEGGIFNGDNAPDLKVRVRYFKNLTGDPTTCNNGTPSYPDLFGPLNQPPPTTAIDGVRGVVQEMTTSSYFDTLIPVTQYGNFDCLNTATVSGLEASASYCFVTCLQDASGNKESSCTTSDGRTESDGQPPIFTGIDSVSALDSGKGVHVSWTVALDDQPTTGDVVGYDVDYTKDFDANGSPVFSSSNRIPSVAKGSSGVDVNDLDTGTRYCFRVSAVDESNNRAPASNNPVRCISTEDNRPLVQSLILSHGSATTPYILPLDFSIRDREKNMEGGPSLISLESLEYQLDSSSDWVPVKAQHITAPGLNVNDLPAGATFSSAPELRLYFNTLAYFAGERRLTLRLILKKVRGSTTLHSEPVLSQQQTVFEGMTSNGGYSRSLSACSLDANAGSLPLILVPFLALALLALAGLRKVRGGQ